MFKRIYYKIKEKEQKRKKRNMNYQQKLKDLREDKEATQKEIADYLSISQTQYHLYESGKRDFHIKHLRDLCLFYHVSADYILGLPRDLDWPR